MASSDRPVSFLPSIKCSNCGEDIEISQLADHICAPASARNVEPAAPTAKLDRAATFGGRGSSPPTSKPLGLLRPGRLPPPKIDSNVANVPFRPRDELSPIGNPRDPSIFSPLPSESPSSSKMPYKLNRSVTSPTPLSRNPPSPDLPLNLDCAFPPFPSVRPKTPTSAKPNPRAKLAPIYTHAQSGPNAYAPLSPRLDGGANILKKLDSIAPGPFDGRRPSTSSSRTISAPKDPQPTRTRSATQTSVSSNSNSNEPTRRTSVTSARSRSSTFSNGGVGSPSPPKEDGGPPPRPPRSEGIDAFLDRLQKETMQAAQPGKETRSRTYPPRKESKDSAPPVTASTAAASVDTNSSSTRIPDTQETTQPTSQPTTPFRPRSDSRAGLKLGIRPDLAPPLPPMTHPDRSLPSKTLHSPSDSALSDDSSASTGFQSSTSSRSSPPTSLLGQASDLSKRIRVDSPAEEIYIPRVASPEMFLNPIPPATERRMDSVGQRRGNAPEPLVRPDAAPIAMGPESPMDPAIQRGVFQARPYVASGPRNASPTESSHSPAQPVLSPEPRGTVQRRPTAVSRGKCRGCTEPIIGKSIKAADGRLTGRYHKQCFVCQTCRAPFQTADFYVFDNSPYCEQHYHELNGSLCTSCGRGIEGAYLETDQRRKFHPKCFTCTVCRVVLRDDYFEVAGRPFCDRHAYHAQAQQNNFLGPGGPGRRNPERRRTRLMMMM